MIKAQKIPFSSVCQIALLLQNFCVSLLFSHNLPAEQLTALPTGSMELLENSVREYVTETLSRIGRTEENIDSIIYKVKQYIDQNYSTNLSLDALATMVHMLLFWAAAWALQLFGEMKFGAEVKAVGTVAHSFIEFFPHGV